MIIKRWFRQLFCLHVYWAKLDAGCNRIGLVRWMCMDCKKIKRFAINDQPISMDDSHD